MDILEISDHYESITMGIDDFCEEVNYNLYKSGRFYFYRSYQDIYAISTKDGSTRQIRDVEDFLEDVRDFEKNGGKYTLC